VVDNQVIDMVTLSNIRYISIVFCVFHKICQPSILCFFYRKSYFPICEVRMDPYVLPNVMG